jgi:hypothetical protein
MSVFTRIFPDWVETRHVIIVVHTAVGFGFLGLATALYLRGQTTAAALRAVFGVFALGLGVYFAR